MYSFFGLFLIIGAATILYAQGYRLDTAHLSLKKAGGIYALTYPKGAELYLDGKRVEETSGLFSNGVLIPSLFPRSYELIARLAGYAEWKRRISVEPAIVSQTEVILIPDERKIALESDPGEFSVLPGGNLVYSANASIYWQSSKLPGKEVLDSSADGSEVLTSNGKDYYLVKLSSSENQAKSSKVVFRGQRIIFDTDPDQFVTAATNTVSLLASGENPSLIFSSTSTLRITNLASGRSTLAWTAENKSATTTIWIYDKFSGRAYAGSNILGRAQALSYAANGDLGILMQSGDFYVYDPGNGTLVLKGKSIKQFAFSPAGTSLALLGDRFLDIYSVREEYTRLNLGNFPEVKKIYWYDDRNFFLNFREELGLLNVLELSPDALELVAPSGNAGFDPETNQVFYGKDGKVLSMKLPK